MFSLEFLEDRKRDLSQIIINCKARLRETKIDIKEYPPEELRRIHDIAEAASASLQVAVSIGKAKNCGCILKDAEVAFDHLIRGGSLYGICIDCEMEIPNRRLIAVPWVLRCAPCQEAFEHNQVFGQS